MQIGDITIQFNQIKNISKLKYSKQDNAFFFKMVFKDNQQPVIIKFVIDGITKKQAKLIAAQEHENYLRDWGTYRD